MTDTLTPDQSGARVRRADLDALRILICGSIILAHALLIFAVEPHYHIKNTEPSFVASVLYEFVHLTTLPVFFVLAGWSALTSLRRRRPGRFVQERMTRLLLPLVVGTVLFGSIIKFIELSHGRDMGMHGFRLVEPLQIGFLDFFPHNLMLVKQVSWSHLWFLAYLFLISVLLLPWLWRLARRVPSPVVPAAFAVYLPAAVMAALLVAFNGYWPFLPNLITDWTNFAYFALCFAIGAGISAWPGFETRLRSEAPRLLVLTLLAFGGVILCGESAAGRLFVGLAAWGVIGAGLGFAARIKPAATPILVYLSEATLPVYIVHHVPLLLLGAVLLPLAMPVWVKIALISLGASIASLVAYHWLIRPWPPVRWLMGMTARRPIAMRSLPMQPQPVSAPPGHIGMAAASAIKSPGAGTHVKSATDESPEVGERPPIAPLRENRPRAARDSAG
jgi:peptidoglycan/LPS O-acetylase OafA/YrhL